MTDLLGVQPYAAPPAYGTEIALPFHIDPATGDVAVVNSEVTIIEQHIISIVLTLLGERLMLPKYGSEIEGLVFAPMGTAVGPTLAADLKANIHTWEPAVLIQKVTAQADPTNRTAVTILIDYSIQPFGTGGVVSVALGGATSQGVTS